MSNLPPREIFEVPLEELHHFGSPPTHEDMVREFALIGSAEAWAKRCGEQLQHGEQVWKAVSELIILGTQHTDANDLELRGMQMLFPTATAATWWIFCRSEFCGDVGLYHELFMMLEAAPRDPTQRQRETFSRGVLRAVSDKLGMESCQVMATHFAVLDAIDAVGQPGTASSTSTKGDGKSSGKGKQ